MRYADGPTTEVETFIEAPPSTVWRLVSDITVPPRFSAELQDAQWLDETRFVGSNAPPAIGEWQTTCTVVESETERMFGWAVGEPDFPSARWRFTLEPAGTGTMLRQWMRIGPAPSGLTPAIEARPDKEDRIIARWLDEHRANMQATVDGIKALAEGRSAGADATL